MRKSLALGAIFFLTGIALATPGPESLRQSPEFDIAEPGHPDLMLSSFKGKVVVMEFLFVRSQHCQRVAQTLNKLRGRGLHLSGKYSGKIARAHPYPRRQYRHIQRLV